jgi:hypothetical protein
MLGVTSLGEAEKVDRGQQGSHPAIAAEMHPAGAPCHHHERRATSAGHQVRIVLRSDRGPSR